MTVANCGTNRRNGAVPNRSSSAGRHSVLRVCRREFIGRSDASPPTERGYNWQQPVRRGQSAEWRAMESRMTAVCDVCDVTVMDVQTAGQKAARLPLSNGPVQRYLRPEE